VLWHDPGLVAEQSWQWRGWLRTPQPQRLSAATAAWIDPRTEATAAETDTPAFGFFQVGAAGPLRLVHVPEQGWMLLCSLVVLAFGLLLYTYPPRFPLLVLSVGIALVLMFAVVAPGLWLAVVYGMQPGLAVLIVVLGVLWVQQRRWRRQVVLMPGFTRLRGGGSSLVRSSLVRQPREQPSTVDAPRPPAPPPSQAAPSS
jgi:hypothetical protein